MDKNLLKVLPQCPYPQGFNKTILKALLQTCHYKDKDVEVFLHLGDAREVLRQINGGFDIVFQDAFSPRKNKQLWTYEYFKDIFRITSKDCIITTYSQNSSMLYSAFLAGFKPYLLKQKEVRDSVIFTKSDKEPSLKIENVFTLRPINMLHKISVNSNLMGLYDD